MLVPERGPRREIVLAVLGSSALLLVTVALFLLVLPACGAQLPGLAWALGSCDLASTRSDEASRQSDLALERSSLERQIAGLERDISLLQCEPVPVEKPQRPVANAPVEERSPDIANASQCAPTEETIRTSEIVFVVDTSSSMRYSINMPAQFDRQIRQVWEEIESLTKRAATFDMQAMLRLPALNAQLNRLKLRAANFPGQSRMTAARAVTVDAINDAPSDMSIGLVTFNKCSDRRHGTFSTDRRPQLVRTVKGLNDDNSTPLALSVVAAAQTLNGGDTTDDPVDIVVLSDGVDSCGGDPCAAARTAKKIKPGLVINVVDLSASGEISCMAEATGGFYRRHEQGMEVADLTRSLREAAGYEGAGLCRK